MFFRMVKGTLIRQWKKMILIAFTIGLGASLATAMLSVVLDVGDKVNKELKTFGANITVMPKRQSVVSDLYDVSGGKSSGAYLKENELGKIKTIFWAFNIVDYTPFVKSNAKLSDGSDVQVVGSWFNHHMNLPTGEQLDAGIASLRSWWEIKDGKWIDEQANSNENDCMIGSKLAEKLGVKAGDKVKGKVVLIADYGAFVEIMPGVEGLIHVSEMSWSPRLRIAQDFLKVGDEVEAQVLSLDREGRKMSLGLKQLVPNPWDNIREKYPVGSQHSAVVRNITNFGVFAELEDGIEGLIHISDLSWDKIKHPSEMVQPGDKIEVMILDFDETNHKLSLGHKQLTQNPWDELEAKYPVGSVVEGTIASITDKGATVALEDGTEAFCFSRELVKEDGKSAVVGEKLEFKVIELRRSTRRILLSHTKTYAEEKEAKAVVEADNTKKAVKKLNSNLEKTTLGDISELAALKDKLEKGE